MCEPVECGAGEALAAEHFGPVLKRQVGRDDQAQPFIGRADDVEQQFRADLAGRDLAQFVQDQQIEYL